MKLKLKKKVPLKPRALLLYDANREIDIGHRLYNEIMLYAESLEELHVFVFIKDLAQVKKQVTTLGAHVYMYYISGNGKQIFLESDRLWSLIKYHLVWKKHFRPDVVLNFSSHVGSLIGYFLALRYSVPFFIATTGAFLELPKLSTGYMRNRFLLKRAEGIFTSGEKTATTVTNRFAIPSEKVTVVLPAVDMSFLERKIEPFNYAQAYPNHNFFLVAQASISHKRDSNFIVKVFMEILKKYPRTALILIVPSLQVRAMKQIVATMPQSIYVYGEDEDVRPYYAGGHIFLATSFSEEMASPVIYALGLHVSVVTTETSIAKEIFSGSRYQEFMKAPGDTYGYTQAVLTLIENQQVRNEYRLNGSLLLKNLTLQNLSGQVAVVLNTLTQVAHL
jgi:glycosyltransferase involved in cell wall biosynthesis